MGIITCKTPTAIAAYNQAAAEYRQIVLQAFRNVADSLRALQHDAETLLAQKQAEIAALNSLKLVQQQFALGGTSYLALLTAQQQYQQARIGSIRAQASRYIHTAALLSLGWWLVEHNTLCFLFLYTTCTKILSTTGNVEYFVGAREPCLFIVNRCATSLAYPN